MYGKAIKLISRKAEVEYKKYMQYLTETDGSDMWKYRNRLYVYSAVQEYIQNCDTIPEEVGQCLICIPNVLEQVWNQYLDADDVDMESWGDIESLMWGLLDDQINKNEGG